MIKATRKQWEEVNIHIPQKQLLKTLNSRKTKDIKWVTLIDDVINLSSLFWNCSFSLFKKSTNMYKVVSRYVVGIYYDEDWIDPQYSNACI